MTISSYPIATIDLSALQYNFQRIKTLVPDSKIMAVIKANAYGHGMVDVARALSASDAFAVARLSEGISLRQAGIKQPIVILEGLLSAVDYQQAADYHLSPVFHDLAQVEIVLNSTLNTPLRFCWLMMETGMHRLGIDESKVGDVINILRHSPAIVDDIGLMSHFANADNIEDPRNQQQLEQLQYYAELHDCKTSMANSGAILSMPNSHGDWLRPGLMLYGISPFEDQTAADLNLKTVMQLSSILIAIKTLKIGDQVGYGGDWVAQQTTQIGIVSIGYGDGYNRQLSPSASVLIQDKLVVVLGRVSMDMIAIDLSALERPELGDKVILWGHDQLSIEQVAKQANTISYELVCQVSDRVKRVYHHG